MVTTQATLPRRLFRAFSRYRSRVLTMLLVLVIAALIMLANLSPETRWAKDIFLTKSYGWPVIWHRFVLVSSPAGLMITAGWYYSAGRLAVNLLLWLLMLAAAGLGCESLLRRYRPRLRWSLRMMLVVVAIACVFSVWLATALDRANLQDKLVAAMPDSVYVERRGPKWLDLVGLDRFRRYIVHTDVGAENDAEGIHLLAQLSRLPKLRSLSFRGIQPVRSRQPGCLRSIGKMTRLEHLELSHLELGTEDLAHLAALTNLKTLCLDSLSGGESTAIGTLPPLPRLEALEFARATLRDGDLRVLAFQPSLKGLALRTTTVTPFGLSELEAIKSLEELVLDGEKHGYRWSCVSASGVRAVVRLKRLRKLHLGRSQLIGNGGWKEFVLDDGKKLPVQANDLDAFADAVRLLRQSRPGIVIDGNVSVFRTGADADFDDDDRDPARQSSWFPISDAAWMTSAERAIFEADGGWVRFDSAGGLDDEGNMVTVSF